MRSSAVRSPLGLLLGAALVFTLSGCGSFTLLEARVARVQESESVAVAVWSSQDDEAADAALEGYLTAALLGRSYNVRPTRLELLLGEAQIDRLLPETYSVTEGMSRGLSQGGELEGEGEALEALLGRTELDDARRRHEGIIELARAIPTGWGIHYMLTVHRFDTFGYAAYVVDLQRMQVINTVVVSANQPGFGRAMGRPANGRIQAAADGDVTRLDMLRLSEYIVGRL